MINARMYYSMKKKIVILGGGSAGWLSALFVKSVWPNVDLMVIEDPATPPIVAGESGSASLNKLYNYLEIDITDWVKSVNAMPKLGGKFNNWSRQGNNFVHGLIPSWYNLRYNSKFPEFGTNNNFLNCALALDVSTEDIFYNSQLLRLNKLPLTPSSDGSLFNVLTLPMWHFDSRANADYLKTLGVNRGIKLIEGRYQSSIRADNGDIKTLRLDIGDIETDWVFDCSGFARLLLQKELDVKFKDYSKYFTANAVVAWWDETPAFKNHTEMTAMDYGWSWNINLKHRQGNGYIYDPTCISVDEAIKEAELKFGKPIDPIAKLKFQPGILEKSWANNVIGIGLSTGFLEPLESNGLAAVAEQLKMLSEYWSPSSNTIIEQTQYNNKYNIVMNDISDFLSLHYRGGRTDTAFWKDHTNNPDRISDALKNKLNLWKNGFIGLDDTEVYGIENYAVVIQGLDLINKEKLKDRLLAKRQSIFEEFYQSYNILKKDIDNISNICYTIEQWDNIIYGSNQ